MMMKGESSGSSRFSIKSTSCASEEEAGSFSKKLRPHELWLVPSWGLQEFYRGEQLSHFHYTDYVTFCIGH